MLYRSTSRNSKNVTLYEAVRHSVNTDGGIYLPERIPVIPRAFFNNISEMTLPDIGYVVANMLFGEDIDSETLQAIVKNAINFDIPMRKLEDRIHTLELFHGPTGSYKDFGARFMAHLHQRFIRPGQKSNILIATRGDAGEAVAKAFFGMDNVRVFVLYPHKPDASAKRRTGFAKLGANIVPVEIRGCFADCLELVKRASSDEELGREIDLQTANSLNVARLLPQTFYYFYAFARLSRIMDARKIRLVVSIPIGNLGNLTSGLIAKRMGLPIDRFIVARTSTSPYFLSEYFITGRDPEDIPPGSVSPNFERLKMLYDDNHNELSKIVEIVHYPSVPEIDPAFEGVFDNSGKAAYSALKERIREGETGIVIGTSSPAEEKFKQQNHSGARHTQLPQSYPIFKEYLLTNALR
ncbi:MAG: pyridoxal-phosphate dependent enzyme [Paramuribaculum sp.]|nr:pyridoxal-phosphate dependent enzyme [Paramuribaculum sp.]